MVPRSVSRTPPVQISRRFGEEGGALWKVGSLSDGDPNAQIKDEQD